MDNLIDNMEVPEHTFRSGNDDHVSRLSKNGRASPSSIHSGRSSPMPSTSQYHPQGTTSPSFNQASSSNQRVPVSLQVNINDAPAFSGSPTRSYGRGYGDIDRTGSVNSDPIPEVVISTPHPTQSDTDLDKVLKMYNRKSEIQKVSEYYAKVESMEREETIKCFVSSMLFIAIVVSLIIIMFTVNPSM